MHMEIIHVYIYVAAAAHDCPREPQRLIDLDGGDGRICFYHKKKCHGEPTHRDGTV
jgi:hypothetical protein